MFSIRLLAAGAVAVVSAGAAFGQGCDTPGGCEPAPLYGTGALFAPNKHLGRSLNANQPLCATKTYPLSDWAYIRKYCGPTLNPGSCYGFYPTKWRRFEEACPQGNCAAVLPGAQPVITEIIPSTPLPVPMPVPMPPKEPKAPEPEPMPAPMNVAPAPLPMIPSPTINATPLIPVKPAEHGKPAVEAPILPLKTLPTVVVPPVRN